MRISDGSSDVCSSDLLASGIISWRHLNGAPHGLSRFFSGVFTVSNGLLVVVPHLGGIGDRAPGRRTPDPKKTHSALPYRRFTEYPLRDLLRHVPACGKRAGDRQIGRAHV